jgi:hypothetical protein
LCYGEVDEEKYWLIFYSYLPVNAPPEKITEVAEFVARANRGMRIGNFELDYDDGEIRYKTAVHVDAELSPAAVKRAVRANGIAMETYLPGIGAVIAGTAAQPALERRVGA